jgi:hypothetical protein
MTQPKFAPVTDRAEVRDAYKLPGAAEWYSHRPADYQPRPLSKSRPRPNTGNAGPDQGYALLLAERLADRLRLTDVEHADDVLAGAVAIGLRRASIVGRGPVLQDLELALHLFGYLDGAPEELVEARERLFGGIAHDYWQQRDLADLIPESTLAFSPSALRVIMSSDANAWRLLTGLPD